MTPSANPPDPRTEHGDEPAARKPAWSGATDDRSVTVDDRSDDDVAGEVADPGADVDRRGALDEQAAGAD
jgi:hypothetical protein